MPPPYTIPENVTDFMDLLEFTNEVTSPTGYHYMGDMIVITLWIIAWAVFSLSNRERPQIKSLIASSYMAFFFAVMMDIVGQIDDQVLGITLAALAISIVVDKIMENR